ncbi:MAG: GNAT family N-acetyltransferase [Planctomycetes bacterium]|nr:GNAT family N-acetyltransferase [Planctomycetota bacterium]
MAQIEPVPFGQEIEAACFMLAGREDDPAAEIQAQNLLERYQAGEQKSNRFWRATDRGRCVAVAMVFVGKGRVGFLLHSSVNWPEVDRQAACELIGRICSDALTGDLAMVQSLIHVPAVADEDMLRQAGLEFLVELIYMSLDIRKAAAGAAGAVQEPAELAWKCHGQGQYNDEQFGRLIKETYRGTLDCPRLPGVRRIEDILASHKASGLFTPQCWLLAEWAARPAGCVLVNDSAVGESAEVVYLGVVPEFRGRRLGKILLARAIAQASLRRRERMLLAVDTRNTYALNIYLTAGFTPTGRKKAYVMFSNEQPS